MHLYLFPLKCNVKPSLKWNSYNPSNLADPPVPLTNSYDPTNLANVRYVLNEKMGVLCGVDDTDSVACEMVQLQV